MKEVIFLPISGFVKKNRRVVAERNVYTDKIPNYDNLLLQVGNVLRTFETSFVVIEEKEQAYCFYVIRPARFIYGDKRFKLDKRLAGKFDSIVEGQVLPGWAAEPSIELLEKFLEDLGDRFDGYKKIFVLPKVGDKEAVIKRVNGYFDDLMLV